MKTTTFLTFVGDQCGKAEEAINFYISLFPNSKIKSLKKYPDNENGGTPELIMHGIFILNGVEYMISESNYDHAFTFTPAVSIFVDCDSEGQMDSLFERLSDGGQVMVPLDDYNYPNSSKFGWCADKYGISWQINLP